MTTRAASLWDFCLTLYQQPHIEDLCLLLQDQWQANVNIVLWLQWLESQGIILNHAQLASAQQKLHLWHNDVVTPLRALRRQMKISGFDRTATTEQLRQTVKNTELMAEKIELEWLSELSQEWCDIRSNISLTPLATILPASPAGKSIGINLTLYLKLLRAPERVIEQAINTFSTAQAIDNA